MGLLAHCQAPPLTSERLGHALAHPSSDIRLLALIVQDAKQIKKLPDVKDLPPMELVSTIERNSTTLTGEDKESAFHIIWYVKELILGRYPTV